MDKQMTSTYRRGTTVLLVALSVALIVLSILTPCEARSVDASARTSQKAAKLRAAGKIVGLGHSYGSGDIDITEHKTFNKKNLEAALKNRKRESYEKDLSLSAERSQSFSMSASIGKEKNLTTKKVAGRHIVRFYGKRGNVRFCGIHSGCHFSKGAAKASAKSAGGSIGAGLSYDKSFSGSKQRSYKKKGSLGIQKKRYNFDGTRITDMYASLLHTGGASAKGKYERSKRYFDYDRSASFDARRNHHGSDYDEESQRL